MASEPENLVLEHLRSIRAGVDALRHDVREIKKTQAAVLQVLASHEARLQHIEDRLDRIERRLELTDA
jgi:septal ring factor EnvC (AmiA/AmiB activator)